MLGILDFTGLPSVFLRAQPHQIPIDMAGKRALKLCNVPSFKVICEKVAKICSTKLQNFTDVLWMVFFCGVISLLVFNTWHLH